MLIMKVVAIYVFINFLLYCSCVPLEEFYPFGPSAGDSQLQITDDGNSPAVKLLIPFRFFNQQHDSLFVNPNGCISFNAVTGTFTSTRFDLSANNNIPIIAPFWADVDLRNGGDVFYRETTNASFLHRATEDVMTYFNNVQGTFGRFRVTWLFIVTWHNVTFYKANAGGKQKRNTFQLVLATNGRHSFAMFIYYQIQWTTGLSQGGDPSTGLGGTPAQVGFSAGNGVNLDLISALGIAAINVTMKTNTQKLGKYLFRIDNETIISAGCNVGGSILVSPRRGTMLGGQKLTMSGPCLTEVDSVEVRYGTSQRTYECRIRSNFSVTCITPTFYNTGDIRVLVTVTQTDGNVTYYNGRFDILNIANTKPILMRTNPKRWKSGQNVDVTWKKEQIPFQTDFVRLDSFYLKEENFDLKWTHGNTISPNIPLNEEKVTFNLQIQQSVVVLRMSPANSNSSDLWQTESVWSDVFPVVPANENMLKSMCNNWYNKDRQLPSVMNSVIQDCPCNLRQALLDTARFHGDPLCNSNNMDNTVDNTYNCLYHGNAHHCIRLNSAGPSGSGRLCCYGRTGNLMDARNLDGAGTVHRHHYFGSNRNIPFLSNFYFDIVPYLQCCIFKKESSNAINGGDECGNFFNRRPESDCRRYAPPAPAWGFGDPHIGTFDGLSYTFNGIGEYVYLRDKRRQLTVQTRMEQVKNNGVPKEASIITSIAARINSDTIEVQLNPTNKADVLINSDIVDFTDTTRINFEGGVVTLFEDEGDETKEVLVTFYTPTISLRIIASNEVLNVLTIVSDDTLKGEVEGLLGDFDSDLTNDLKSSNGTIIPMNSTLFKIHYEFGETWRIREEDSLFSYPIGKNYTTFANPRFQPSFIIPVPGTASELCSTNVHCLYDQNTTGLNGIPLLSKQLSERFEMLKEVAKPVVACGLPPNVKNGQWNSTGYTSGSTSQLSCFSGFVPTTSEINMCGNNGMWNVSSPKCVPSMATVDTLALTVALAMIIIHIFNRII